MRWLLAFLLLCGPVLAQNIEQSTPPNNQGMTWNNITCGSSSTPFGAANAGGQYLSIWIPPSAANVCFAWGGTVAVPLTATTSGPCYPAQTSITWGGGYASCIASTGTQGIWVGTK